MYTVIRSLNNNIVVSRDSGGRECVLTGSGIGFGQKAGGLIPRERVEHVYLGLDKLQERWLQLLAQATPETLEVAQLLLQRAEQELEKIPVSTAIISLSAHLSGAIERVQNHIPIPTMMRESIMLLYPTEYRLGEYGLQLLHERLGIELPDAEASVLALFLADAFVLDSSDHLLLAQNAAQEILQIVQKNCPLKVGERDAETLQFGVYIKLRCWLVSSGKTHAKALEIPGELLELLYGKIPGSRACIQQVAAYLEQTFQYTMQPEDILNFLLRVNRMV